MVVAAHPYHDGDLPTRFFQHEANYSQVLAVLERRGFARGAAGNKEIDPLAKLELHQLAQRRFIHGTVFPKGGDEGRAATANFQAHGTSKERNTKLEMRKSKFATLLPSFEFRNSSFVLFLSPSP